MSRIFLHDTSTEASDLQRRVRECLDGTPSAQPPPDPDRKQPTESAPPRKPRP